MAFSALLTLSRLITCLINVYNVLKVQQSAKSATDKNQLKTHLWHFGTLMAQIFYLKRLYYKYLTLKVPKCH